MRRRLLEVKEILQVLEDHPGGLEEGLAEQKLLVVTQEVVDGHLGKEGG